MPTTRTPTSSTLIATSAVRAARRGRRATRPDRRHDVDDRREGRQQVGHRRLGELRAQLHGGPGARRERERAVDGDQHPARRRCAPGAARRPRPSGRGAQRRFSRTGGLPELQQPPDHDRDDGGRHRDHRARPAGRLGARPQRRRRPARARRRPGSRRTSPSPAAVSRRPSRRRRRPPAPAAAPRGRAATARCSRPIRRRASVEATPSSGQHDRDDRDRRRRGRASPGRHPRRATARHAAIFPSQPAGRPRAQRWTVDMSG